MRAQKFVYNAMGKAVPDIYSANNKVPSRYYYYFVTQTVQTLLGNGVMLEDSAKERLGKSFDRKMQELATYAQNSGVGYAFFNFDHIEAWDYLEFVPLLDEYTSELRAGVRFWQLAADRPLMFTLYEEDGYTEYKREPDSDAVMIREKTPYIQRFRADAVNGTRLVGGSNYKRLPIIPLYNINKQSELVGMREVLDAYDLMASALVNNVDDGNLIYWVIKNCGGMDAMDDERFVEQLKMTHVVHADGDSGVGVDAHKVEAPFEANEAALERLRKQLFEDAMALDVSQISAGNTTATQINAAYEPLNSKLDSFEANVTDCIEKILELIGIEDTPTYTRSKIVNVQEEIQTILSAYNYLSDDYITQKVMTILGDIDRAEEVLQQRTADETSRFTEDVE